MVPAGAAMAAIIATRPRDQYDSDEDVRDKHNSKATRLRGKHNSNADDIAKRINKEANKTIVYSDTVLPIKDLGKNIIVTTLENIDESSFESCLSTIFESNANTIFNTIQYSKSKKKIYFYTDQKISTKKWEDRNVVNYKPITRKTEILAGIKKILSSKPNENSDCISLYDISKLIERKHQNFDEYESQIESQIKNIMREKYPECIISILGLNNEKNELKIGFNKKGFRPDGYEDIIFSKKDDDLYLKRSESNIGEEILYEAGNILSELYDELLKYEGLWTQRKYDIIVQNSIFLVDISDHHVSFFVQNLEFKLSYDKSFLYGYKYYYNCNSNTIINAIKGNEDKIFKKVFVKINDCPKWSQSDLYKIKQKQLEEEQKRIKKLEELEKQKQLEEEQKRIKKLEELEKQKQLEEQQKAEEERKIAEEKNQKRLTLKRRFFPFLKK